MAGRAAGFKLTILIGDITDINDGLTPCVYVGSFVAKRDVRVQAHIPNPWSINILMKALKTKSLVVQLVSGQLISGQLMRVVCSWVYRRVAW